MEQKGMMEKFEKAKKGWEGDHRTAQQGGLDELRLGAIRHTLPRLSRDGAMSLLINMDAATRAAGYVYVSARNANAVANPPVWSPKWFGLGLMLGAAIGPGLIVLIPAVMGWR